MIIYILIHVYNNISKFKNNKFIPVFSQSTSPDYADIPIINIDDIKLFTKMSYPPNNNTSSLPKLVKWSGKNIALFRGIATGCGVTEDTNQRIKLAKLSYKYNNKNVIDAGFNKLELCRNKIYNKIMTVINPKKLGFPLVNTVSPSEQSYYVILIHVDGHVSANYRNTKRRY